MGFIYAICLYNDVRRYREIIVAYNKGDRYAVPVPSTFIQNAYTYAAMDNGEFINRSSISGTESGHITMQVLYQEVISTHGSKPRVLK